MKGSEKKPKTVHKEGKHIPAYLAAESKDCNATTISKKKQSDGVSS